MSAKWSDYYYALAKGRKDRDAAKTGKIVRGAIVNHDDIETVLDALQLGLDYARDAEGLPERFHPGVVRRDVAKIKAAVALLERALGGAA